MWFRSRRLSLRAVSRPIKASVSSRLGRIGKRLGLGLGLGMEGRARSWYGLGQLGLVHIHVHVLVQHN